MISHPSPLSPPLGVPRGRGVPRVRHRGLVAVRPADAERYGVAVATTRQRLGGVRRWLVCPGCGGRRAALFARAGALACRRCWRLRYGSQLERLRNRLYRRAFALYDRIGTNYHVSPREHAKPTGMHWRTYRRLRALAERYDRAALGASVLLAVGPSDPFAPSARTWLAERPRRPGHPGKVR